MRLSLMLPNVEQQKLIPPTHCPHDDCRSTRLRLHQEVVKPLRDTSFQQVTAYRYQCLQCKRTFRVYPPGVNSAPTSQRVKDLGVVLYLLGLSYRSVSHALEALGVYLCASCVYSAVQTVMKQRPELKRQQILEAVKTFTSGTNVTNVKFRGRWIPLHLSLNADGISDGTLALDQLTESEALELAQLTNPLAMTRIEEVESVDSLNEMVVSGSEQQYDTGEKQFSAGVVVTPALAGG